MAKCPTSQLAPSVHREFPCLGADCVHLAVLTFRMTANYVPAWPARGGKRLRIRQRAKWIQLTNSGNSVGTASAAPNFRNI